MTWPRVSIALVLACMLAVGVVNLSAQGRARVRVALVGALSSPNARAEILRFGTPGEKDIILLPADRATPRDLAVALSAYRALQRRAPAPDGRVGRTSITSYDAVAGLSPAILRRAEDMLRQTQSVGESRIGNLGRGRWEEFDVVP